MFQKAAFIDRAEGPLLSAVEQIAHLAVDFNPTGRGTGLAMHQFAQQPSHPQGDHQTTTQPPSLASCHRLQLITTGPAQSEVHRQCWLEFVAGYCMPFSIHARPSDFPGHEPLQSGHRRCPRHSSPSPTTSSPVGLGDDRSRRRWCWPHAHADAPSPGHDHPHLWVVILLVKAGICICRPSASGNPAPRSLRTGWGWGAAYDTLPEGDDYFSIRGELIFTRPAAVSQVVRQQPRAMAVALSFKLQLKGEPIEQLRHFVNLECVDRARICSRELEAIARCPPGAKAVVASTAGSG